MLLFFKEDAEEKEEEGKKAKTEIPEMFSERF